MAQSASPAAARVSAVLDPEVTGLTPQPALERQAASGAATYARGFKKVLHPAARQ
jgi:hypothetical protein